MSPDYSKEQKMFVMGRPRLRVLDPISRVSEIIFGLLMALSFTGTLSVATAGREEVRTLLYAALGCNLAWGIADAVMYFMVTLTGRARNLALLRAVRSAATPAAAHQSIAEALPGRLGDGLGTEGLEEIRRRLIVLHAIPRPHIRTDDFVGAVGVFLLVFSATFPVAVPFMLISDPALALRTSNGVALVMLFIGGYRLGRYGGIVPWKAGLALAAVGAALVFAIIALGG